MEHDLVIKNGMVITALGEYRADIGILGEKIASIGENLSGRQELDATGKLVTPGAVDIHVHLEMPIGQYTSTDDFYEGTVAAAFGGTTSVIDFVETRPEERMETAIGARRALADPKVVIDYGLHMTIAPTDIDKLDQVPDAFAAGCTTYKLYMAYGHRLHDGEMLQALTAVRDSGGLAVIHAENWDIIQALTNENLRAGRTEPHWHPRSRPAPFEAEATSRVVSIAQHVDLPLHIFHVSCEATVRAIAAARAQGLPVTGETCPQYLLLTQEVYDAPGVAGTLPVCAPPIREQHEQDALWQALRHQDLQLVSSDHCPFTPEEKGAGLERYSDIPGGVPSIEMRFAAIYSAGVRSGRLSRQQWIALCCTTPARLAGLAEKGDIAPGFDADLVIFDPEAVSTVSTNRLHETAGWTPYEGLPLRGWPETTLVRGRIVTDKGRLQAQPGDGRYIHRTDVNL